MRFHRGRRDAVCALLKKVAPSRGATERKHTVDASSNVGGAEGRGGEGREGESDAGRAVATPGVR